MPEQTQDAAASVRLRAATEELLSEMHRLPAELITWIPAEGVWSVMDILVDHLLVQHVEKHLGQIRRNAGQFAEARAR